MKNNVVVLPCKVGDTVYVVDVCASYVVERKVTEISQNEFVTIYIKSFGFCYPETSFGKTVFMSRAVAENVLKERKENDK